VIEYLPSMYKALGLKKKKKEKEKSVRNSQA
jgi:hypothetical protein